MNFAERAALADDLEAVLRRHVGDAWFPRSIDRQAGGFLQDFDRKWQPRGAQDRMLEVQARQTRSAAVLAMAYPRETVFAEAAAHGFRYLRDVMWDREHGGWFWLVDRHGAPLAGGLKHGHSTAYAVAAATLVHRVTGEPGALDLAREGFAWFDARAHDVEHGGYHGWLTRDGKPVLSAAGAPPGTRDPLGHAPGLKDVNVHGDWLEALGQYAAESRDPVAGERVLELGALYVDRLSNPAGELHYAFHRDWSAQPGPEHYGYVFQAATRLSWATSTPGASDRSRALMAHALSAAAAPRGGYMFAGPAGPPSQSFGRSLFVPLRVAWVQFEALRALIAFACSDDPDARDYDEPLRRLWRFIRAQLLDEAWGGTYELAVSDLRPWQRPITRHWNPRALRKAHAWKDASHETDALTYAVQALRVNGPRGE